MLLLRSPFLVARLCSFSRVVKFLPVSPIEGLAVGAFHPQILHKLCFHFLLDLTMVPRENKNNAYAKFGGTNK